MTEPEQPPRRISSAAIAIDLTGYLIPTGRHNIPLLLAMPGTPDKFIPIFSSQDRLDAVRATHCFPPVVGMKIIQDGALFLASLRENDHLPFKVRVAIDPHRHEPNGRLHFLEIPLDGKMPSPS